MARPEAKNIAGRRTQNQILLFLAHTRTATASDSVSPRMGEGYTNRSCVFSNSLSLLFEAIAPGPLDRVAG